MLDYLKSRGQKEPVDCNINSKGELVYRDGAPAKNVTGEDPPFGKYVLDISIDEIRTCLDSLDTASIDDGGNYLVSFYSDGTDDCPPDCLFTVRLSSAGYILEIESKGFGSQKIAKRAMVFTRCVATFEALGIDLTEDLAEALFGVE